VGERALPLLTATDTVVGEATAAVLPVGSFEQHGGHLPFATDTLVACTISNAVAAAYGLLPLPPVTIACSHEHSAWHGTVSIRASTLYQIVNDIRDSLNTGGISKLLIVSAHGGNYVLSNVVQEASTHGPDVAMFPTGQDWAEARKTAGLTELDNGADMHGGELETSLLLHAFPEAVRESYTEADHVGDGRPNLLLTVGLAGYTSTGIIGRPAAATAEKGEALLAALVDLAGDHLGAIGVYSGSSLQTK
jgi:creatinine amidohydrolase